ncbi:hypothetical protein RND81_01G207800 [Saponaria officinalis]|uniref:SS18 N-terminal domain-containing protein n=1 Tax=Saponaria officinalis TaxID=3572 RepID=A0AAW1NHQ9_SAPOF
MQQQSTPSMMPIMSSPANLTTDQIQMCLDENKKLILAIMDNQNLGKLAECAQYQAQLQKNLMYLAAIADDQPQVATMPTQVSPHPAMHQGAYYMQQQASAAAMAQQPGVFHPRMLTQAQFNSPLQIHQQQHQQTTQHFRPTGPINGMHTMQSEGSLGGGSSSVGHPTPAGTSDSRRPNKPEDLELGSIV